MVKNKSLFLLRHAQAENGSALISDVDRPLHLEGLKQCDRTAQAFKNVGMEPDLILVSSALRTYSTALLFCKSAGITNDLISIDSRIYNAPFTQLLQVLETLPEDCAHVMVVGHNPGISELASSISGRSIFMNTCSMVGFDLGSISWRELLVDHHPAVFELI